MRANLAWVVAILCAACASSGEMQRPAVLIDAGRATRADLLQAVTQALDNAPLTLADDALTHENALILEPARRRDANGRLLNGRELGVPERFELFLIDSRCVLIHERTQRRILLGKARCRAL